MVDCIEKTGRALNLNNQGIVKYLCGIEEERKNLELIIQKQYQERKRIEAEIERLTYKLCLINKSLSMRIKAKNNYDKTIEDIKAHYECLVASSNKLRQVVEKTQQELDDIMNKKTGTSCGPDGAEITTLFNKPGGDLDPNQCLCTYGSEVPTKEKARPEVKISIAPSETVIDQSLQELKSPSGIGKHLSEHRRHFELQSEEDTTNENELGKSKEANNTLPNISNKPDDKSTTSTPVAEQRKNLTNKETFNLKESSGTTYNDLSKRQINDSKNLLFKRLRPSTGERPEHRLSTLVPTGQVPMNNFNLEEKDSNDNSKKLHKRSIEEVLRAVTPYDSSTRM